MKTNIQNPQFNIPEYVEESQKPLKEVIEELYKEFLIDSNVNDERIEEEVLRIPTIRSKWVTIRSMYEDKLRKYKELKYYVEKVEPKDLYDQSKKSEGGNMGSIKEAERKVMTSKRYKKIKQDLNDIETLINQINGYIESFNHLCYGIKNKVDIMKMEEMG